MSRPEPCKSSGAEENERIEDRVVVKVLGFEVPVKIRLIRAAEDAIGGALRHSEKAWSFKSVIRECVVNSVACDIWILEEKEVSRNQIFPTLVGPGLREL